jgi:hypothetical protein
LHAHEPQFSNLISILNGSLADPLALGLVVGRASNNGPPHVLPPISDPRRKVFCSLGAIFEDLKGVKISIHVNQMFNHVLIDFGHGFGVADRKLGIRYTRGDFHIPPGRATRNDAQDTIDFVSGIRDFKVGAAVEHSEPMCTIS